MPEGDTVFRQCAVLHAALAGARLTRGELRVPRHGAVDLGGWEVLEVRPRGKHVLIRMRGPAPERRLLTLHSHLVMDGTWRVRSDGRLRSPRDEDRKSVV